MSLEVKNYSTLCPMIHPNSSFCSILSSGFDRWWGTPILYYWIFKPYFSNCWLSSCILYISVPDYSQCFIFVVLICLWVFAHYSQCFIFVVHFPFIFAHYSLFCESHPGSLSFSRALSLIDVYNIVYYVMHCLCDHFIVQVEWEFQPSGKIVLNTTEIVAAGH